jgi:hypothetical protein
MNKEYRFHPTRKIKRFMRPELAERDGEISDCWDEELMALFPECFEEIKEPYVLSVEQIVDSIIKNYPKNGNHRELCTLEGIKNGRLDEWQRKEQVELREEVRCVLKNHPNEYGHLRKAFEGLKPPYEK